MFHEVFYRGNESELVSQVSISVIDGGRRGSGAQHIQLVTVLLAACHGAAHPLESLGPGRGHDGNREDLQEGKDKEMPEGARDTFLQRLGFTKWGDTHFIGSLAGS